MDHFHARHARAGIVGQQPRRARIHLERDIGIRQGGPNPQHLGIRLGLHQARESVARGAPDAAAVGHVVLQQPHSTWRMEWMQPGTLKVVGELLDTGLVSQRGEGIRRARRSFGGILATRPVDLIQLFGGRVPRLHLGIADGPCRRDAVVVLQGAEVLGCAGDTTRRHRTWWRHRPSNGCRAGTASRRGRTRSPSGHICCPRTRPSDPSSPAPVAASRHARGSGCACLTGRACWARVPPPAPLPMMMTS